MRWLVFCIALCLFAVSALAGTTYEARITIDDETQPPRPFSALLFSGNLEWTRNGSSLLNDNGADYPHAVQALRGIAHPALRFPGGRLASTYQWQKGVGPLETRGQGLDFNNKPETIRFGTDEFLTLLGNLSAQGMITVNPKVAPAQIAQWLQYIRKRSATLDPSPSVPYWEVGNETYLAKDPSFMPAAEYAKTFAAMRLALREVDPDAKVGALLEANFIDFPWVKPLLPQLNEWNATVLDTVGNATDFYSIHLYGPFGSTRSEAATRQAILAVPGVFALKITKLRQEMAARGVAVPLYVTEYNILTDSIEANWKYSLDPLQSAYIMDTLLVFAQADIAAAFYWASIDAYNFGLLENAQTLKPRPAVSVFTKLAPYRDAVLLGDTVQSPLLRLEKVGIVTHLEQDRIAALNALCLRLADGKRVVLAVNRSMTDTAVLDITSGNAPLTPQAVETITVGATATLQNGRVHIPPATGVAVSLTP